MEDCMNIHEEMFCLQFEINALSEVTLKNESERWIPGFIHEITEHDHIERYKLAAKYSKRKEVLDIACGVGRGSYMLKTSGDAAYVQGCDIDVNAIRYAKHRNLQEGIKFQVENAEEFIGSKQFDLIVSFETIEHLKNYDGFLKNTKKNLKRDGRLIISTPISNKAFNETPDNPYHVQEWGFVEFQNLLGKYFKVENVFTQLYQNEFFNEKLGEEYTSATKIKSKSIAQKILDKVSNKNTSQIPAPTYLHSWNSKANHSVLEKFTGQFEIEKLGTYYSGYQLLICKKEHE